MNIYDDRIRLGLSQMAMAIKVGVSLNTYINWEKGVTKPTDENERKLKEVIECQDLISKV